MLAEHERWDFEIRENYAGKWIGRVLRMVLFGFLEYSSVNRRSLVSMGLTLFGIMQAFALVELLKSLVISNLITPSRDDLFLIENTGCFIFALVHIT